MKKILGYILLVTSCLGCFEIPEEGTISDQVGFSSESVNILLKTQQIMGSGFGLNLKIGETTFPFQFSIEKVVRLNEAGERGEDVTAQFTRLIKIKQWKEKFTKKEKTREEFEAKREEVEVPVLAFTKANELIFNYGHDDIEVGFYMLDVRVTNSSGSKVFEGMLKLNVKEAASYMLTNITHYGGEDKTKKCSVIFEKRGSDREFLTVRVEEKSGEFVPMDSITFTSPSYSFDNTFHFTQEHTAAGTNIDIPFPIPYKPSDLSYPLNIYRGQQLEGHRWKRFIKVVQRKDENGKPMFDKEGKPVMDEIIERKKCYGFSFKFMMNEPGDWLMTIKFE